MRVGQRADRVPGMISNKDKTVSWQTQVAQGFGQRCFHAAALAVELIHNRLCAIADGQHPVPGSKMRKRGITQLLGGGIIKTMVNDEAVVVAGDDLLLNDLGEGSPFNILILG